MNLMNNHPLQVVLNQPDIQPKPPTTGGHEPDAQPKTSTTSGYEPDIQPKPPITNEIESLANIFTHKI